MSGDVHDFYGPYQVREYDDGQKLVFIKGIAMGYSIDSPILQEKVQRKLNELNTDLMKWQLLEQEMKNA